MKALFNILFLCFSMSSIAQVQTANFSFNPNAFNEDELVTITVSGVDPTLWNAGQPDNIYLWTWVMDATENFVADSPTNGSWTASNEAQKMTNNGDGTYSFSLTPDAFYGITGIEKLGMLVKAKDGTNDKKSQDFIKGVGFVIVDITEPQSSFKIITSGSDLTVNAKLYYQGSSTASPGSYEVYINDVLRGTGTGFPTFSKTITNVTEGGVVKVVGTPLGETVFDEATFDLIIAPTVVTESMPAGINDGINYNSTDATKATLVLNAPLKDFIYVAGSFNNYTPDSSYLMKQDPTSGKFWLELSGLTSGQIETYQYWVYAINPVTNSPSEVKTADPFSTLILSSYDDPYISANTYPNLPDFPEGQEREVTVLQTGQTPYDWQVTNFSKPKKEDLIVYEVLVRDFDANRNYQDLIDRIDYFKNLNINAIELMPVMEFEGNESWGYNTSYHMALDKFYGTENKLKELIDICHQNGIAVILDIAINHAFGRNPMVRMWMNDPEGDGWGDPSSENPYFNEVAKHTYSVGSDFNHQQATTQYYTERVVQHWIEEFKIDGFRWDLTKGFTQNCNDSDQNCTNNYQQDRVDILKEYADYSWSLDPNHYVIFEHLGSENEEKEWANYRFDEGKGVMLWGKMSDPYSQLTMGYASNSNFNGVGHKSRTQFLGARVMGYPESHDEERIMYKNLQYGNQANTSHDVRDLNTALSRMSALGAVSITVPGPKMLWHFADLGMENSIFTCYNGTVNEPGGTDGDCKLDTKPQPQWDNNWLADTNRNQIYNDWSRLNYLKINEAVFEGDYTITSGNLTPRIDIWDDNLPNTQLKNVIVLANFDVTSQNVNPNFPYAGVWYDLMDETGDTTIDGTTTTLSIAAGQFRIFGNKASTLNVEAFSLNNFTVYPNPVNSSFSINKDISNLKIFDITGKLIKTFNGYYSKNASFNISELKSSIYILKIENTNGQVFTSKLIKI